MKVFLSYAEADEKWADLLRRDLSKYGFAVWNSKEEVVPGDNPLLKYGRALQSADAMVVLVSPASVKSDWVRSEIDYALSSARFRDRLVPVLLKPTSDVPWILENRQVVRATKDVNETVRRVARALSRARGATTR
jgi:hypothetical protein